LTDPVRNLLSNKPRVAAIAAGGVLLSIIAAALFLFWAGRRVDEQQQQLAAAARIEVEVTELRAPSAEGVTLYLNAADVRATAAFGGVRYLATSGGLAALEDGGGVRRRYTTLDGLPENDLTALAVFADRLFIGTAASGLLSFDGGRFTRYRFRRPEATRISTLVPAAGELLIGTLDGGLFEYDGQTFSRRLNSAPGADFNRVTAILPVESRVYVGTQDRGLYIWREAQITRVGTAEGLPSPRVTGLAAMPPAYSSRGVVIVATDFGVLALGDSDNLTPFAPQPNVTSIVVSGNTLLAGLFSGGVIDLTERLLQPPGAFASSASSANPRPSASGTRVGASLPGGPATVHLDDGVLWVLTAEGAFTASAVSAKTSFHRVAGALSAGGLLTAGHITSAALDDAGRLWIGYFERGVDLIDPRSNEKLSHLEDEYLRQVNFLAYDKAEDRMLAATSRGLVVLGTGAGAGAGAANVLTRDKTGLISNSIAHVALGESLDGSRVMALATAGGLTEISGGRTRSLTAFHGLASNHLYCAAFAGARLFVGSLSGLVELEELRVIRTYKTSSSRLSHDWVTALTPVDGTLYIGTNGGGVDALLAGGEWINFEDVIGRFEVNQNAMHYDGGHLFVGTTDRGLLVYDTRNRSWNRISAGLSSSNVTAVTSDEQYVYAGTPNGMTRLEKRVLR
jgi:ligand-binding sensor domain-containing protein